MLLQGICGGAVKRVHNRRKMGYINAKESITMNIILRSILSLTAGALLVLPVVGDEKKAPKPPEKVVFAAKTGEVTFDHKKHLEREKGKCETCHTKLFPQSKAPINFKTGMHKAADAAKTQCAACHFEKGPAFATKGNCANSKCHVKGKA